MRSIFNANDVEEGVHFCSDDAESRLTGPRFGVDVVIQKKKLKMTGESNSLFTAFSILYI